MAPASLVKIVRAAGRNCVTALKRIRRRRPVGTTTATAVIPEENPGFVATLDLVTDLEDMDNRLNEALEAKMTAR